MKKILYFMGVDWYWIKQRPQILAEYLEQDYDVTVVYIKELFQKQSLRKDQDELEKSIAVPVIPYRDKSRCAYSLQRLLFHKVTKHINEYDTVWIGHPLLYRYIPQTYKGKIIYDCMDNHLWNLPLSHFRINVYIVKHASRIFQLLHFKIILYMCYFFLQ